MAPRLLARLLVSCAVAAPSAALRPAPVDLGRLLELEAVLTPVPDAKRRSADALRLSRWGGRLAAVAAAAAAVAPGGAGAVHVMSAASPRLAPLAPPLSGTLSALRGAHLHMAAREASADLITAPITDSHSAALEAAAWAPKERPSPEEIDGEARELPRRKIVEEPLWMSSLRQQVADLREHKSAGDGGLAFRGTLRSTGKLVEVRVLGAKTMEERRAILNEVGILEQCGGGDVLTLFGAASAVDSTRLALPVAPPGLRDANVAFLFQEPVDHDLNQVLLARFSGRIGRRHELRLLIEILRGLRKLEKAGYVHRDVRPETIMIVGDCFSGPGCHAKIGGLWHARAASALRSGGAPELLGDPMYIAPEVWRGRAGHRKADVWGAGLVAYGLCAGGLPNQLVNAAFGGRRENLREHPLRDFVPKKFEIGSDARFQEFMIEDSEMAGLIRSMLTRRAAFRPSLRRALARAESIARSRHILVPEQE